MIERILNANLPLIAYNPPRVACPDYFQALHDAGAMPVLDTAFMADEAATAAISRLGQMNFPFGVRVSAHRTALLDALASAAPPHLDLLVLGYRNMAALDRVRATPRDCKLLIEAVDVHPAESFRRFDPHGLIVRGHEAGGMISRHSAFVLMQHYLDETDFPVFVHGGVGRHTAAGIFAAGASGIVMDAQFYLTAESPLSSEFKTLLAGMEEGDTRVVGQSLQRAYRVFAKLGTRVVRTLKETESRVAGQPDADEVLYGHIHEHLTALDRTVAEPVQSLLFLGQDAVFAKHLIAPSDRLADVIHGLFATAGSRLALVEDHDPMVADSPLARVHGTTYPIVQGPMANISDTAEFARAVLDGGALPFLAVASLPVNLADRMLAKGAAAVPRFGAGLIGIEALNQGLAGHLELVKQHRVPFALFAAGQPAQVRALEEAGIKTYLHTPSPAMLDNAVAGGCRRFIFEGTEAGGHVGSLSSLVLWELAMERLLGLDAAVLKDKTAIFAGGIGTGRASHFVSGMTAVLASRGARVGIQVGSAYLFTEEIVATGALKERYQEIICDAGETVVVGRSVGLASRTVRTPFSERLMAAELAAIREARSSAESKEAFERDNFGSLLIGAKGCCPDPSKMAEGDGVCLRHFSADEQYERGNFMVGGGLVFDGHPTCIADVHHRLFGHKAELTAALDALEIFSRPQRQISDEIAVIGMGCIFPDAPDADTLWQNIVEKKYAIGPVPADRFDPDLYWDQDPKAPDRSYTRIAGVVSDFTFDHEKFGYTPEKAAMLSRSQQMILEAAYQAVAQSGYLTDDGTMPPAAAARTAVVVATCLGNEMTNDLHLKYYYPELRWHLEQMDAFTELDADARAAVLDALKSGLGGDVAYEPVHGMVLNMEPARIAHHLGVTGANYAVDAACASSLAALDCGVQELLSGNHDTAIVGGLNTYLAPEAFVGFCKMGALSATGSFPFDKRANGFVLGEGAGVVVLKRMRDALRDKDPILGIINAMGGSSDGRGKAIAAPNPKGQALALERCFSALDGRITPADIDYVEAHGTSTIMGDRAEMETLRAVYGDSGPVGISSVKSQIGHLLGGAGVAGLIKVLLALGHKTLPPNGGFETLAHHRKLAGSELYIIENAAAWETAPGRPRRGAVSSYGFGGVNYHCVLEAATDGYRPMARRIFQDPARDADADRIVVAGLGVVLPGAKNIDEFWTRLETGESAHIPLPDNRFHNDAYAEEPEASGFCIPKVRAGVVDDYAFDNRKYRLPPRTAQQMDRAQCFGLDAAAQALDQSGLGSQLSPGNRTAVILGTIPGERQVENVMRTRIGRIEQLIAHASGVDAGACRRVADDLALRLRDRYLENNEDTIPGLLSNILAGRIANVFGCNGPNFVVDSSCASATQAIDLAVRGLRTGQYDCVVTGGADANLYPSVMLAFKRLGLLADNEPRIFDENGCGYVMGEGAAVQVLTTYGHAKRSGMPILGEICGSAIRSSVPDHLLSPSDRVYGEAMNACYRQTAVARSQVRHLDVFAGSNPFLDAVEKQAVEASFSRPLAFGNVKPEFGYFKAANPAVVVTKLILMAGRRTLLPNRGFKAATSLIRTENSVLRPRSQAETLPGGRPLYLAANVNGIGGNHGHMVVGSLPAWLDAGPEPKAAPTAEPAPRAMAVAAPAARPPMAAVPAAGGRTVALLSGQGAQQPGMMQELYETEPDVRRTMDQGNRIFAASRGTDLLPLMFGRDKRLNLTENTQPAVFLSSAAVFDYLQRRGFAPDVFLGHSVGEYTALYCSGMLDFDAAMALIIRRADLMKAATEKYPGRIMAVFADAAEAAGHIAASGIEQVWVANKNSARQTAVSGAADAIDQFGRYLKENGVTFKKLALSGAFHTPLFDSAARGMAETLATVTFHPVDFSRVISNRTAEPYPADAEAVKGLLVSQIVSPVEFLRAVAGTRQRGADRFVEIGPGKLLVNLLRYMDLGDIESRSAVDPRSGQKKSLADSVDWLGLGNAPAATAPRPFPKSAPVGPAVRGSEAGDDFEAFLKENTDAVRRLAHEEFLRRKREQALAQVERFGFYTGAVAVAGVSVGLPGTGNKVFDERNFDRILSGQNFIEPLTTDEKERILDMNITRVFKEPDGHARLVKITHTRDVIQLAGKLGYFNLASEYGIDFDYDITNKLAIAAGIEALKDANIPLVMRYKAASTGQMLPNGYALPEPMQNRTGVILTSLFPGFETLIDQMNNYYYNKFYVRPYKELENIYYHLMAEVTDPEVKEQITDWFFKIRERRKRYGNYKFDRALLFDLTPLGSAHFAQLIGAKGPNMQMSGACASTTQAVGVAEDWIRTGRCDRVIVIGGEAATSETQSPWVASGFLALGAATINPVVADAAKPFDAERNGTILGSGAVSVIVERADTLGQRGLNGQAEILGTYIGNSAFHATRIEVDHVGSEMARFVRGVEQRHGLSPQDYTPSMVFMSHETFTPARGGSADAEVDALRRTYPDHYPRVTITNTKGFTGHTLGAAIEDAVLVKALQKGVAPPIANLTRVPENFADLNFSRCTPTDFQYGLHFAAGFGSHFAFLFLRRIEEAKTRDNPAYLGWLKTISGSDRPELKTINNTLCLAVEEPEIPRTVETPAPAVVAAKPAESPHAPDLLASIQAIIAEQTGYTVDMLEPDLDLEADLGIDTVKQVEVFGRVSARFGLAVPEDLRLRDLNTIARLAGYIRENTEATGDVPAEIPPSAGPAADQTNQTNSIPLSAGPAANENNHILATVQAMIAEQTGYTVDMLEPDLDLEADLGIDTVKQVEVFGRVSARFGLAVPEDLRLRDLNTIARLAGYIRENAEATGDVPAEIPPSAGPAANENNHILATVQAMIAEQTGYTVDMLEPDLDLEADLGIDTVKQVEVFGRVSARFGLAVPEDLRLRDLNTIARLADYIRENAEATGAAPVQTGGENTAVVPERGDPEPSSAIGRFVVRAAAAGLPAKGVNLFDGATILVSTDGFGFAEAVERRIIECGGRPVMLDADGLADPDTAAHTMETMRAEHPELAGMIHLSPLDLYFGEAGDEETGAETVRTLFALIRTLAPCLDRPNGLFAFMGLDSMVFPYADVHRRIVPAFAGMAGLVKSAAKEMPAGRFKAVDFSDADPLAHQETLVDAFVAEIVCDDPRVEAGYADGQRYVPSLVREGAAADASMVQDGDTLLVTGGARGITFEILSELVRTAPVHLVILGRSDIETADAPVGADRAALMEEMKRRMPGAKPVAIQKAVEKALGLRRAAENVEALRRLGARVDYHAVDVTDVEGLSAALGPYERIDGVIHGAGIQLSRFIGKKSQDEFNRVFDTKVRGTGALLRALEPYRWRYFFAFSSVTARFGNEAQTDYTAANDMMGKMIQRHVDDHPSRIGKVLDWTAWEGAGMATDATVKQVLEEKGLAFLPLARGVRFFMDELCDAGSTEAVFSGTDPAFDRDGLFGAESNDLRLAPFLDEIRVEGQRRAVFNRRLDLKHDLFLLDHSREGIPIFLGATGIEAMAEAAARVTAGKGPLTELADFEIPYGIKILKARPKDVCIEARRVETDEMAAACRITSQFHRPGADAPGAETLHYQGTFRFGEPLALPPAVALPNPDRPKLGRNVSELIYHPSRLFMDGVFRSVEDVVSMARETLLTRVRWTIKGPFFAHIPAPDFLTDVVVVDAMFQSAGIHAFMTTGEVVLPKAIGRMQFFQRTTPGTAYLCRVEQTGASDDLRIFSISLMDEQGTLYLAVEDFKMVKVDRLPATDDLMRRLRSADMKIAS
jgi:acyl transferase domain-containing protein/NAD(P)H-dependent flavin oxidoreductase YrpB (nitropropane dioxygenase family)/acyl carrier protein/NAD(P)-dependent dehydrogenase (short-subunit alcohol dehydrogenase family)